MEGGTETNKYLFVKLMGLPLVLKTPLLQRYPFLFHDFAHFIHLGFYVDQLDRVAVAEVCGGSSTRNRPINIIAPSNIQRSEFALSIVDDLLTNEFVFLIRTNHLTTIRIFLSANSPKSHQHPQWCRGTRYR